MPRIMRYFLVVLVVAGLSVGGWFAYLYLHNERQRPGGTGRSYHRTAHLIPTPANQ